MARLPRLAVEPFLAASSNSPIIETEVFMVVASTITLEHFVVVRSVALSDRPCVEENGRLRLYRPAKPARSAGTPARWTTAPKRTPSPAERRLFLRLLALHR